jgi:hypothetical protein
LAEIIATSQDGYPNLILRTKAAKTPNEEIYKGFALELQQVLPSHEKSEKEGINNMNMAMWHSLNRRGMEIVQQIIPTLLISFHASGAIGQLTHGPNLMETMHLNRPPVSSDVSSSMLSIFLFRISFPLSLAHSAIPHKFLPLKVPHSNDTAYFGRLELA